MKNHLHTILVRTGLSLETRSVLKSAVKWLERIHNRREDLPKSFLDGCDPGPLAKKIRGILAKEEA